jgi:hypothetical protein
MKKIQASTKNLLDSSDMPTTRDIPKTSFPVQYHPQLSGDFLMIRAS